MNLYKVFSSTVEGEIDEAIENVLESYNAWREGRYFTTIDRESTAIAQGFFENGEPWSTYVLTVAYHE